MALTITPLTPSIAAEVRGIDLTDPISDDVAAQLHQALADHSVLVIREQQFTPAEYLDAVQVFGEPMLQHYSQYHHEELPLIGVVSHRNGQKPASMWHTDHTNHECPPKATVLYAVSLPSAGGNTSFASMRAAYTALPDETKQRLAGLRTVNTLDGHVEAREEDVERYGTPVTHPLIRTHPDNGTKAIYFHPTKSKTIEGMTLDESRTLLEDLLGQAIQPEVIYRHQWQLGDMVIFDNRSVMHKAHGDYDRRESRLLYRLILRGERPV